MGNKPAKCSAPVSVEPCHQNDVDILSDVDVSLFMFSRTLNEISRRLGDILLDRDAGRPKQLQTCSVCSGQFRESWTGVTGYSGGETLEELNAAFRQAMTRMREVVLENHELRARVLLLEKCQMHERDLRECCELADPQELEGTTGKDSKLREAIALLEEELRELYANNTKLNRSLKKAGTELSEVLSDLKYVEHEADVVAKQTFDYELQIVELEVKVKDLERKLEYAIQQLERKDKLTENDESAWYSGNVTSEYKDVRFESIITNPREGASPLGRPCIGVVWIRRPLP